MTKQDFAESTTKGQQRLCGRGCCAFRYTTHSLYVWIKRYDPQQPKVTQSADPTAELAKLRKELQRVTEERDILK